MNDQEMLDSVRELVNDERLDRYAEHYLGIAKGAVLSRLFPFDPQASWSDVPEKHHAQTVEMAVYLVNKRGAEGEVSHTESGVSRTYESGGIPKSYFRGIVPFVGVPR